jgi:hypothetical protein
MTLEVPDHVTMGRSCDQIGSKPSHDQASNPVPRPSDNKSDVTYAMSMTDTRAQHLSKSSKIGSALTQVWVNASWVYPEDQYAHMGTSE